MIVCLIFSFLLNCLYPRVTLVLTAIKVILGHEVILVNLVIKGRKVNLLLDHPVWKDKRWIKIVSYKPQLYGSNPFCGRFLSFTHLSKKKISAKSILNYQFFKNKIWIYDYNCAMVIMLGIIYILKYSFKKIKFDYIWLCYLLCNNLY